MTPGAEPLGCRFCGQPLEHVFADLGETPFANSYLEPGSSHQDEAVYPLVAYVCAECFLVQLPEFESPESIFGDYAYFSSYSDTWLAHASDYTERMVERFGFDSDSLVVELASNDGYLLKNFRDRGIPVLGIEPARNVAQAAEEAGIPTRAEFFGVELAETLRGEGLRADLLLGNNVLAHVPDLNDFVRGMHRLLAPEGILTMEFPHLMRLMADNQFDTIYHEHFSYFSFTTVRRVFAHHGLELFDVEELPTHGGSLRIFGRHGEADGPRVGDAVPALVEREAQAGFGELSHYLSFEPRIREVKRSLLRFLAGIREEGKRIVGYGAPAKGNTLLNYCGIGSDSLEYTVDRSPHKQGRLLPGSRIPIHAPERVFETRPDYLLILPWNLRNEIAEQMAAIGEWGGRFAVAIPRVETFEARG